MPPIDEWVKKEVPEWQGSAAPGAPSQPSSASQPDQPVEPTTPNQAIPRPAKHGRKRKSRGHGPSPLSLSASATDAAATGATRAMASPTARSSIRSSAQEMDITPPGQANATAAVSAEQRPAMTPAEKEAAYAALSRRIQELEAVAPGNKRVKSDTSANKISPTAGATPAAPFYFAATSSPAIFQAGPSSASASTTFQAGPVTASASGSASTASPTHAGAAQQSTRGRALFNNLEITAQMEYDDDEEAEYPVWGEEEDDDEDPMAGADDDEDEDDNEAELDEDEKLFAAYKQSGLR